MCLRGGRFFLFSKICLHFSAVCLQFSKKKLPPLKRILALPTWGQICTVSVLQPFLSDFFQMKHPVFIFLNETKTCCKHFTRFKLPNIAFIFLNENKTCCKHFTSFKLEICYLAISHPLCNGILILIVSHMKFRIYTGNHSEIY